MAASKDELIKQWIQFLKNNQIVGLKSDPVTNDLSYKRPVTVDDVTRFLNNKTDYSEEQINNAIKMVMSKGAIKNQPEKLPPPKPGSQVASRPQQRQPDRVPRLPTPATNQQPTPKKSKYSKDGAQDIKYRDINEAIKDIPAQSFSEEDVEAVFSMLSSIEPESVADRAMAQGKQKRQGQRQGQSQGRNQGEPAPPDPKKQEEDTKKLMRIIRDTMTPTQRKMLWRALQDGKEELSESQINPPDVKAVLKGIAEYRPAPSTLSRIPGLRKDKITVADLQKAWAEGDKENGVPPYSDDTRDIKYILSQKFGYGDKEIGKVFTQIFGQDSLGEPAEPSQSPAIQRLADYAKKNGVDDAIIGFMKREFSKELGLDDNSGIAYKIGSKIGSMFKRKAVAEEVRDIFTAIVNEEQSDQPLLIRNFQQSHLGRTKK